MNSLKTFSLVLVTAVLLVNTLNGAEPTKDSLATVKKNVENDKAVLVDVREKGEWDDGHITDATFLPLSKLRNGISPKTLSKRISKDQIIYTHCVVGIRSCSAADILLKYGYDVRPLKPGYDDLVAAGFKKAKE
ncbi:MAG: rhodanese-like domain-containing protein [Planctomycetota bacterium]